MVPPEGGGSRRMAMLKETAAGEKTIVSADIATIAVSIEIQQAPMNTSAKPIASATASASAAVFGHACSS
jgi:hypothetical protein